MGGLEGGLEVKRIASAIAGGLLMFGCADPYNRGPTILGGWNVTESKSAREIKEEQPDGSSVRWAADCQYTLLGAFPYWGGQPNADDARAEIMRTAPNVYTSTVEGETSIHAWNLLFVFQTYCVELAVRFDGIDEPNTCEAEKTDEFIQCVQTIPATSPQFDLCRQQGEWACRPREGR